MKKFIKKFWGVGLIVIILSSLFVAAAPVTAADPLRWESKTGGPSTLFNAISPGNTVYDFVVAANAATIYAATANSTGGGGKLWQSVNGGSTWTEVTSRLPAGFTNVNWVALAPDDANIVAVVTANASGNYVAISVNGGVTFTDMVLPTAATQSIKGLDISALVTGGFRYVSVFGSTTGTNDAVLYYFNYGAGVGAWRNAVTQFTTLPSAAATIDNIVAVQFSPNFASDYMAVALSEQIGVGADNGTLRLHVLSFNSLGWDNVVAAGYPVVVTAETSPASTFNVNKAAIALGPDYSGGDETLRVAFVGADITGNVTSGGIWRMNDVAAARNLLSGVGIASVSFDGTNLAAGAYATNNAYHCSDPLASSPTVLGARNLKRIGVDDAGNDIVQVMYVGATLFGAKRGAGGAISKSLDAGNTWNDFTMINQSLTNYDDIMVSADGATWYAAIRDTAVASIFRMSPMQRVLCVAVTASDPNFILRGVASDANVIYAADLAGTTIYYSADGGVSRWQQRLNVPAAIADLAVESQNVIYFGSTVNIYKSINNGFTWNTPVNTTMSSGAVHSVLSLGENKLLVGSTTGGVLYSKDGGTTWTRTLGVPGTTEMHLAASGLETGNFIFAAPANSKLVYRCEIGPSNPPGEFKDMNAPAATLFETNTGLIYQSGVLYALSANTTGPTYINSTLSPTKNPGGVHALEDWRTVFSSALNNFAPTFEASAQPTALKVSTSTGKVTLWAVNKNGTQGVRYFDDTLALIGPTITGPADKALVQTNSITGLPLSLNFLWARPSLATSYELQIATDSAFVSRLALTGGGIVTTSEATAAMVLSGGSYTLNPGSSYYWRVRAVAPISSAWSETRTFTIQPVAASVPAISSPLNGSTITNQSPAFSWSPVTGTTKYEFQLSTTPTFGTTVLTDTPASAGTLVPVTIKLDQGKQYFWRVRASEPVQGDWSTVANFLVALPATSAPPPVTVTNVPAPTITIPPASPVPAITLNPPKVEQIAPSYIWAIIIIGGILVIAVIVLIVRTRRSV